jgi:hypothetical protein
MSWLHVDQRAAWERCEAATTRAELRRLLGSVRLVPGATPDGVAELLGRLPVNDRRRTLERAIPRRGRLRRFPAGAAALAVCAAMVGLAWVSPWLLLLLLVLSLAAAFVFARRWALSGGPVIQVARMEQRASDGDLATKGALYAEARAMIAEDRVPARVGFRIAHVLEAAVELTPFPPDLLEDLERLLVLAPETELMYAYVRDKIERGLQLRCAKLGSRLLVALRDGTDAHPVLDECAALIGHAPARQLAPMVFALDKVAAGATDAIAGERARSLSAALRAR